MQYEAYENKIKKVASVLAVMLRYAVLIISGLVLVIGATVATVALKGTVISSSAPERYAYGESATFEGKAFLSKVSFEFSADGIEWSSEQPTMPGSYKVRTCTKGSFGMKYGEPKSLVIDKAKLEISAADSVPYYGEQPLPSVSGIVAGDSLAQVNFLLSSYEAASAAKPQNGKSVLGYAVAVPDAETIKIVNVAGEDVTNAYDISAIEKKIALSGANSYLKIVVEDKDKIYDGVELSWDVYELVEGTLVGEDAMYATFDASIKNVGTVKNTPELVIINKDGDDVTGFYKMDIIEGTLTVNARPLLIESGSAEFVYDSQPHSCKDYTISSGTLLDGHELKLKSFTKVTDVSTDGKPYHNVLTFDVMNGAENVTSCYSIMLGSGDLVMKPMTLTAKEENITFEYDGKYHEYTRLFEVDFEAGKADYRLQTFVATIITGAITDVGEYSMSDIPTRFINKKNLSVIPAQNFVVEQEGAITITPKKITISAKDIRREYDGETPPTSQLYTQSGELCEGHSFFTYIRHGGNDVGINEFTLEFAVRDYANVYWTDNYEITGDFVGTVEVYPRAMTVYVHDVTKIYDDTLNVTEDNGWSVDRLISGYRLEITKITGDIVDVGIGSVTTDIKNIVVYDNNNKKDPIENYDIKIVSGTLTIDPRPVRVITNSAEKVYDGNPLTHHSAYIPSDMPAVPGHQLEPVFLSLSSITEVTLGYKVGQRANELDTKKTKIIRTSDNKDVTKNYEIYWEFGTLTITQRPVTVSTYSGAWVYDGKEHYLDSLIISGGKLVSGHFIPDATVVDPGAPRVVGVGKYLNEFENIVIYASGNRDVTHNYAITQEAGTLAIHQREITILTDSASKVYDTTPLIAPNASVPTGSPNKLVSGHTIRAATTQLTDVGRTENAIIGEVNIFDASGDDVTANYKVVGTEYGELVVTKCPTRIITNSAKQAYNGSPLSKNRATLSVDNIPGVYAVISGNPSITRIGSIKNTCDQSQTRIFDFDGNDITANFTITGYDYGTLTVVHGVEIQIAVYSTTKTYTGRTVTVDLADVTKPIVDSNNFIFDYSAIDLSLTDVDAITLDDLNAQAHLCNVSAIGGSGGIEYIVKFVTPSGEDDPSYACLEIVPKALEITAASKIFNYKEGAIFASNDFDITRGSLVNGHKIEVICEGMIECHDDIYDGYSIENRISSCRIIDKNGRDVTFNYDIKVHSGKLTVQHLGDVQ